MKYCNSCGNGCADSAAFCNVCGAKLAGAQTQGNAGQSADDGAEKSASQGQTFRDKVMDAFTNPTDTTSEYAPDDVNTNRIFAVLSYIGFLFIIPLIAVPNSKFAKFHANQGLVLFITELLSALLYLIPIIGWALGAAAGILLTVLSVLGLVNAIQGKAKELPFIGKFKILN